MGLKNAWYGLIGREIEPKRKDDPRHNHTFTPEDTEHAVEMRKLRQETARIQQKMALMEQKRELQDLKRELYDDEDGEDDEEDNQTQILQFLAPILGNLKGGAPQAPPIPAAPPQSSNISDEDIRAFIVKQDRKHIKLAKTMPKEIIKRKVLAEMPMSDAEFERAHQILMTEF